VLVPAATEPQLIVLSVVVHALLEYTPRLGEVVMIVPDEVTSLFMVMAAMVVTVNAKATMASEIANIFDILCECFKLLPIPDVYRMT